jgi:hypothetical protein
MKLNFLTAQSEIKFRAMFEDLSAAPKNEPPLPPEGLVVSGHADGGVVIRQRGAADQAGGIVVPAEQAEGLIAAIRRHLQAK